MKIDEAKTELACYGELTPTLKQLSEKLTWRQSKAERSTFTHSLTGNVSTSRNYHDNETSWADLIDIEAKITEVKIEIENIRQTIAARVAKLPPQAHYMLFMRHIKCISMAEIRKKKDLSERTAYRIYAKSLAAYADSYEYVVLDHSVLKKFTKKL